ALSEVHPLVAEEDLAVDVVERVPRVGHVERIADDGVVPGEEVALTSHRERDERPVDRATEGTFALVADAEAGKFATELLEQLLAGHPRASCFLVLRSPRCSLPSTVPLSSTRPFTRSNAESSRRPSSCARKSSMGPVPVPTSTRGLTKHTTPGASSGAVPVKRAVPRMRNALPDTVVNADGRGKRARTRS